MVNSLEEAEDRKNKRNLTERVVADPEIRHGKPVIRGTRVSIEVVLGSLAGGTEIEKVCEEYELEREDVYAAIDYARRRISGEELTSSEA